MKSWRFLLLCGFVLMPVPGFPQAVTNAPAISLYDTPKYKPGFKNFDYVNPDAPKGGRVRLAASGPTFDSLNPYILKGIPADGLALVSETLMKPSFDEPNSMYGLVAESVTVPASRNWAEFTINPKARFSDGTPVTADDVVFSFNTLREKGSPSYRIYFAAVEGITKTGGRRVRFTFKPGDNRELPMIVGSVPVLSKSYYERVAFDRTSLDPPLGTGPYLVDEVRPGRTITYRRNPDWWGRDLPVNRGYYNFDRITFDYYRDPTVQLEAFKAGRVDFRLENVAKNWATAYDFPAVRAKRVLRDEIRNEIPNGMQAFVFNTRRSQFADVRVRQALNEAFDFEWMNRVLFFGIYRRITSYFANSELASSGIPQGLELKTLEPFRKDLPREVFDLPFTLPVNNTPDSIRFHLTRAQGLLEQAGYVLKDGKLVNAKTGEPFRFEILLSNASFERVAAAYIANLKKLGITATLRVVDASQYQNRIRDFDFDMIVHVFPQSVTPGNEQRTYWDSEFANIPGSQNMAGIKNPVIDKLVQQVVSAPDWASLKARSQALDRVLLWNHYVIPNWYSGIFRIAWWDKFGRPDVAPKYALGFPDLWWQKPVGGQP